METRRAISAGGVIFRLTEAGAEVAITARSGAGGVWALPKGTVEASESLEETAVREVAEETGLTGQLIGKIGVIDYWFVLEEVRYHKFVHFYLLRYIKGETSAHDREVEAVEWLPLGKALSRLTFKGEREILEKAERMIEELS
ncbi:MAG: NUDIX hydrolase [Actinobacteria bacterium]|nr:NUDIX hydrolase [Actinomycetota bacterium]